MNEGQRLIYADVMLRKQLESNKPVHLFLTGGAGIGKTFVLNLLVQGLLRHYIQATREIEHFPTRLIMAYTRKATFNIGGMTIHSALHLPLISNSRQGLSSKKLDLLSTQYNNLKFIVIDEISLVGKETFALVDTRLRSILHTPNKPFGNLDVILCGNLFQASPVRDA